jgi:hypothetical protein
MKASEIKVGTKLVLDMGYGAHSMNETCTVVAVRSTTSFFGKPVIRMMAKRLNGELTQVFDHEPDMVVTVAEELT